MIQCSISTIAKPIPGEVGNINSHQSFQAQSWEMVIDRLQKEYDIKIPKEIKPIYEWDDEGNDIQVGFVVSKWDNSDPKTKQSQWLEHWVSFKKIEVKPIKLHASMIHKESLAPTNLQVYSI
jgi:hypothetical protein